jgi:hypothetical protein
MEYSFGAIDLHAEPCLRLANEPNRSSETGRAVTAQKTGVRRALAKHLGPTWDLFLGHVANLHAGILRLRQVITASFLILMALPKSMQAERRCPTIARHPANMLIRRVRGLEDSFPIVVCMTASPNLATDY